MIKNFEAGKWYRYDGHERLLGWNSDGEMDFVLDNKPQLCSKGCANMPYANFADHPRSDGDTWNWEQGLERWHECEAPTSTTTGGSIRPGSQTFNPGDRVVATADDPRGETGTVVLGPRTTGNYLVEFDTWDKGHDGGRLEPGVECKPKHGYWLPASNLKPLDSGRTVSKLDVSGDYPDDKMDEFIKSARSIDARCDCGGVSCQNCPATRKYHGDDGCCDIRHGLEGKNFVKPWFAEWLRVYAIEPSFDSLYEVSGVKLIPPITIRGSFDPTTESRLHRAKRLLATLR